MWPTSKGGIAIIILSINVDVMCLQVRTWESETAKGIWYTLAITASATLTVMLERCVRLLSLSPDQTKRTQGVRGSNRQRGFGGSNTSCRLRGFDL